MKKIQRLPVWLREMVRMIAQVAMAGEKRSIAGAPARKECNKFDLTAGSVFLIGPS
jgi:hypothetical protein